MPNRGTSGSPRSESRSSAPPSSRAPSSHAIKVEDSLASTEKMARRVEQVRESDPVAAAILAHDFLSRHDGEASLSQRGQTDEWITALTRLRAIAARANELPGFQAIGPAYLAAKKRDADLPLARDTNAVVKMRREEVRGSRRLVMLCRAGSLVLGMAALASVALIGMIGVELAVGGGALFGLAAVGAGAASLAPARRLRTQAAALAEVEKAGAERAAFEASPEGRGLLQRVHEKHPLLVKANVAVGPASVSAFKA